MDQTVNNSTKATAAENKERQIGIDGWGIKNQERLSRSKALVLGTDIPGQLTIGSLVALGVRDILFMDNTRTNGFDKNFLLSPSLSSYKGIKKTKLIEETARKIDDNINIRGVHSKFSLPILDFMNFDPDIILDTQNNRQCKEQVLDYAFKKKKKMLSTFYDDKRSVVSLYTPENNNLEGILDNRGISEFNQSQGYVPAGVAVGIMLEEYRRSVFTLDEYEKQINSKVIYNLESKSRFNMCSDNSINLFVNKDIKILLAGAGAIGNYAALNLALSGFSNIDVLDMDHIESHNLARQILLYSSEGQKKADVLSRRINQISKIKSTAIVGKLTEYSRDIFSKNKYDVVLGCFDNQDARYRLSDFAREFEIPYIDGGSSPFMGSVSTYFPKKTACVRCKKNLKLTEKRTTCQEALPSVIMPNIIAGSMMVGEVENMINGNTLDEKLVFDATAVERLYAAKETTTYSTCSKNHQNGSYTN